ncbi:MAG: hypothetical protein HQL33_03340 [Alphaproteobacteria bacterium]|nr:hypothetical protein [Alphaproteobacteria bacterium]
MATSMKVLAAVAFAAILHSGAALAAPPPSEPADLVDDRPWLIGSVGDTAGKALETAWDAASDLVSSVLPPSPSHLASTEDEQELVKLMSYAGYKLKEIDSQVGIIPTIAFKFALVRELSEADWDFLDYRLELSRFHTPGLLPAIKRAIVEMVMRINTSGGYQVSELKVQMLPLPKVAFSITPKVTALGEESSALMRAIQRMEKRLRGDIAVVKGKVLPRNNAVKNWPISRDEFIGAAILLFVAATLVEIWRRLRPARLGRPGPAMTLGLLGLGAASWVGFALQPLSPIVLAGGIAMFGLVALVVAGKGATRPVPPPATEAVPLMVSPPAVELSSA